MRPRAGKSRTRFIREGATRITRPCRICSDAWSAKGFVRHVRGESVLVFAPTVDRDELIRRRLQGLADKLCGGAMAPLVMNLVRSQPLSESDVEQLYVFLREQRRRSKTSPDPK